MSTLTLTINKQDYQLENLDARTTLLDVCRQHLQITGPKKRLRPRSMRGMYHAH
ncbi:periplasmic aromatic aldehyde oxidoreductase, iron-sulfur subunit YagT [Psychrobacter sp. JCM 18901]|uniref:hypothetical protein n=1 Tax=Psychrobacter sp. JCM 18901 TaxID=1298609 RepID=UPI000433E9D8|nr:hypothetical protein [Psychrobacter sp. JCM 18901]GAF55029.1 periplasmic aromatic aldehyde oxidoreductase, iron-sulfur subunit YagT [Psychrobacter sp. JCM 18901]